MERAVGEMIFWQVCVVGCAARTLSGEQLSLGPSEPIIRVKKKDSLPSGRE